jgi:alpha-beta hydrolase superfamily lysophospholipase
LVWAAGLALFAFATLVIGGGVQARSRLPELKPWHRFVPSAELRSADMPESFGFDEYLRREQGVFDEVRREIEDRLSPGDRIPVNRYWRDGRASPSRLTPDWNRSFEMEPAVVRGGALLVHGLTDSPYSMRALAEVLREEGFYALALRMPGHGTVPAGLTDASWPDWVAAVRVGARHVRRRVGDGKPFVIVGYSNGGALAVKYALDVLDGAPLPPADRLILVSPMIGVTPFAGLARYISALGPIPYFEKARWIDVVPEYNPFKYNSFPAHAGQQTYELTRVINAQTTKASAEGRIGKLPPILTFQSLVDATVSAPAVVTRLYDLLQSNGSELVVFDVNRWSGLHQFLRHGDAEMLERLIRAPRRYQLTVVTNVATDQREVAEHVFAEGAAQSSDRPLGLAWPEQFFSLSHVGLPFRPQDPIYGVEPAEPGIVHLGRLSPRGERAVLTVPVDVLMRVTSNPFFPLVEQRVRAWVRTGS